MSGFVTQELANTAWAFATVGHPDAQLFTALARVAELKQAASAGAGGVTPPCCQLQFGVCCVETLGADPITEPAPLALPRLR